LVDSLHLPVLARHAVLDAEGIALSRTRAIFRGTSTRSVAARGACPRS